MLTDGVEYQLDSPACNNMTDKTDKANEHKIIQSETLEFPINLVVPYRAIPEIGNIGGDVPAELRPVQGRVDGVDWFEHVEGGRVRVEHLCEERRAAALIRQNDN